MADIPHSALLPETSAEALTAVGQSSIYVRSLPQRGRQCRNRLFRWAEVTASVQADLLLGVPHHGAVPSTWMATPGLDLLRSGGLTWQGVARPGASRRRRDILRRGRTQPTERRGEPVTSDIPRPQDATVGTSTDCGKRRF